MEKGQGGEDQVVKQHQGVLCQARQAHCTLGWQDVEKTLFSEEFDKTQHLLALVFSGLILEDKLFIFSTFQTGHLETMIHENLFSCLILGFSKENQQMQRN